MRVDPKVPECVTEGKPELSCNGSRCMTHSRSKATSLGSLPDIYRSLLKLFLRRTESFYQEDKRPLG